MYRAFDLLTTAAVRHPSRVTAAVRWTALFVLGLLLVSAIAAGNAAGSILFGVLTAAAMLIVMRGVYATAAGKATTSPPRSDDPSA